MQFPKKRIAFFFLFRCLETLTSIFQTFLLSRVSHIYELSWHNYLKQDLNYRTAMAEGKGFYKDKFPIHPT